MSSDMNERPDGMVPTACPVDGNDCEGQGTDAQCGVCVAMARWREARDRQVMTATRLQLIRVVEEWIVKKYGTVGYPIDDLKRRIRTAEIKLPDAIVVAKRRGRRITYDDGQFKLWEGGAMVGCWWPTILEADRRFAELTLRWLAGAVLGDEEAAGLKMNRRPLYRDTTATGEHGRVCACGHPEHVHLAGARGSYRAGCQFCDCVVFRADEAGDEA